jgi:hypothetical protein
MSVWRVWKAFWAAERFPAARAWLSSDQALLMDVEPWVVEELAEEAADVAVEALAAVVFVPLALARRDSSSSRKELFADPLA